MPRRVVSCLAVFLLVLSQSAIAQDAAGPEVPAYQTARDVPYRSGEDVTDYMRERCKLDVYYPTGVKDYPTVVWFHGGGLTGGGRFVPNELKDKGIAVVAVDYRLSPRVKAPAYIEDAAAAIAWTRKHIVDYGGDPDKVFIAGHSAGGYLVSMVGLDKSYLAAFDQDPDDLAGIIPFSGHTITHFTVREERGISGTQPIIDSLAPLFHVRPDAPPILLITGDRELEMLGRYEENAYFWRMLKVAGDEDVELLELPGLDHGGMPGGAYPLLLRFIEKQLDRADADAVDKAGDVSDADTPEPAE